VQALFSLADRVALITGGAGLLGREHASAIHAAGGIPVLADLDAARAHGAAARIGSRAQGLEMDVTQPESIAAGVDSLCREHGRIDILINNAAHNPIVDPDPDAPARGRLEDTDLHTWNRDLAVGLTGAMLCSRIVGAQMRADGRGGVVINIASDLALIGPDQRLYARPGRSADEQSKKPVSYSVVKSGLLGLTRYLATYWADAGIRVNALCFGGVRTDQPPEFLERIARVVPMGRMACVDEYRGAIVFLCSDASSYMTGSVLTIDGGRTCW
jgi:NAD(P)-dependent dehydrogenase (short-subunit alcohol dehydrogenase family)